MAEDEVKARIALEDKVTDEMKKMSMDFTKTMAEMAVSVFTAEKAWELFSEMMKTAIDEFSEGEAATWGTKIAIEGLGKSANITIEQVNELTDKFSKLAKTEDNLVQNGINKAIQANANLNKQQLEQLIPTSLALAKIQGDGKITSENYASAMTALASAGEYPERALRLLKQTGMGLNEQQMENVKTLIKSKDSANAYTLILGYLGERTKGVLKSNEGMNQSSQELSVLWKDYLAPAGKMYGTILEYIQKALGYVLTMQKKVTDAYTDWGKKILEFAHLRKKDHEDIKKSSDEDAATQISNQKKITDAIAAAEAKVAYLKKHNIEDMQQQASADYEAAKSKSDRYYEGQEKRFEDYCEYQKRLTKDRDDTLHNFAQMANSKNIMLQQIGKAAAVTQVGITTAKGAIEAYEAMVAIPVVGPLILGPAAAAAIGLFGAEQIAEITGLTFPAAARGAFVPGSNYGTPIIAGDQNRAEYILNDTHINKIAKKLGNSQSQSQTSHLVIDKATLATWHIKSSMTDFQARKTGQLPNA